MQIIRKSHLVLELVVFLISAGAMGYFAQKNMWLPFTICTLISAAILGVMRWLETAPIIKYFSDLEKEQNRIALNFEAWGIKEVFNMRHQEEIDRRNAATRKLIEEGNRFALLAESGASFIDPAIRRHWDTLKQKLDQGSIFRLLILDPFCTSKSIRNERNGIKGTLDPKLRLERLLELSKVYSDNVEIRVTSEPYCSLFITDKGLMYDPYHLGKESGRIENYFLALQISKSGDEKAYWLLNSHFEALWERGMPLEAWRRSNRQMLSQN